MLGTIQCANAWNDAFATSGTSAPVRVLTLTRGAARTGVDHDERVEPLVEMEGARAQRWLFQRLKPCEQVLPSTHW